MRYVLALLTHGLAPHLDECLRSFAARLSPHPHTFVCVVDGPGREPPVEPFAQPWLVERSPRQEGFCAASGRLWKLAAAQKEPFVFWLENDFLLLRPLDVGALAAVLEDRPTLAQMACPREPVNAEERRAGGVIAKHRARGDEFLPRAGWLEHGAFFTTNPSLMRREFLLANPFPHSEEAMSECEGRFGLYVSERGWRFGMWGDGSPLVRHIGKRTGYGY